MLTLHEKHTGIRGVVELAVCISYTLPFTWGKGEQTYFFALFTSKSLSLPTIRNPFKHAYINTVMRH